MPTRTNIVLDDELIAQAMVRAGVTTKKAAVDAALKAYVRKPDYSGFLALQGSDPLDPDYDPRGPYGLTPAALARRGWATFEEARNAFDQQTDGLINPPVKKSAGLPKVALGNRRKKRSLAAA
jgi:hypothetical protein